MSKAVRYSKDHRERAKQKKCFLITVSVDGREARDGSCTVQRVANLKMAREVAKYAMEILRRK